MFPQRGAHAYLDRRLNLQDLFGPGVIRWFPGYMQKIIEKHFKRYVFSYLRLSVMHYMEITSRSIILSFN